MAQAHRAAGMAAPSDDPQLRSVWARIRRTHGTAVDRAAPLTVGLLRPTIEALPPGLAGTRDRALLLVGFAGALRRSELVAFDVEDRGPDARGAGADEAAVQDRPGERRRATGRALRVQPLDLPGPGRRRLVPASPAVRGPLVPADRPPRPPRPRPAERSGRQPAGAAVGGRAGLPPGRYSAHSLRAGLATSATHAGVSERAIMNQTCHRSLVVARGYIRQGTLLVDNAAGQVGL